MGFVDKIIAAQPSELDEAAAPLFRLLATEQYQGKTIVVTQTTATCYEEAPNQQAFNTALLHELKAESPIFAQLMSGLDDGKIFGLVVDDQDEGGESDV